MEQIKSSYKRHFTDRSFILSILSSIVLLVISLIINFYAGTYAARSASNPVTDIILSNIRAYDLDAVFVYGSFLFFFVILFFGLQRPQRMPYIIKSIALFVIIRSLFITMTHLGTFPTQITVQSDLLSMLTFGGDLFFSGHTGLPFLLALVFWKDKWARYIFILFSMVFAVTVLLSHMHYTIDVASAFFITFTIYHIAEHLFKKDQQRFDQEIDN
jgi:divalent metal cation (Fe/Co/Zn/Cd) transporter